MRIIAFITVSHEVAKILKHIGEQTAHAPHLMPTDPVPLSCDFDYRNCRLLTSRPSRAGLLKAARSPAKDDENDSITYFSALSSCSSQTVKVR